MTAAYGTSVALGAVYSSYKVQFAIDKGKIFLNEWCLISTKHWHMNTEYFICYSWQYQGYISVAENVQHVMNLITHIFLKLENASS